MADHRSSLDVVKDLLGLTPDDSSRPSDGSVGLVGSPDRPRFLLPTGHRAAALASCLAFQGLRAPRIRANRAAVAAAVRIGATNRIAPIRYRPDRSAGSLLDTIARLLGRDHLEVAVGLGARHGTWRPTLQVFDDEGEPIAYVKVGPSPLPASLVQAEAEALEAWTRVDDPRLVVPDLLGRATWQDAPVMAVAPLPADSRRLPSGDVPGTWPVRTLDPPLPDAALATAPWWTERRLGLSDHPVVAEVLDRIEERHGSTPRAWARWHGDWVPWNLARSRRGLVAWDWEYSEPGAPVGLDDAHGAYQRTRLLGRAGVADALIATRVAAPDPWVADAHIAMLVTRAVHQARVAGAPVADHDEVLDAAPAALARR